MSSKLLAYDELESRHSTAHRKYRRPRTIFLLATTRTGPSGPRDVNTRLSAISNVSSVVQRINRAGQICAMEIGEWLHDHLSSFSPDILCSAKPKYLFSFLCILNSSS